MSELFDTHTHLHDPALAGEIEAVLERARQAGVQRCITIGTDLPTSRAAAALAEAHDGVYAAVGVHPHDAKDWSPAAAAELRRLAASDHVVGDRRDRARFLPQPLTPCGAAAGLPRAAGAGR